MAQDDAILQALLHVRQLCACASVPWTGALGNAVVHNVAKVLSGLTLE
jgi:hypothetical protein